MKKFLFLSVLGFFIAGSAHADFDIGAWNYKKTITSLPSAGGFVRVNLDREVKAHAQEDLGDIRIMTSDGVETSFQLVAENVTGDAVRAVVFQPTPGAMYALYYGNSKAALPEYHLARYFQYEESAELPIGGLGAEELNGNASQSALSTATQSGREPDLFVGLAVLMVALVTFFLIAHLKKLKHAPRGETV